MASQTASEQGKAELRILNFKTTWSDFQKPCQTTAIQGKAEVGTYNLKKTSPPQSRSQAVVCISTPRMYPRSGYFLVYYVSNAFFEMSVLNTHTLSSGGAEHPL